MWKKTQDELPKYNVNVLLAVVDEESGHHRVTYGWRWCTNACGERFKEAGAQEIYDTVYAWMPVPEAPKFI